MTVEVLRDDAVRVLRISGDLDILIAPPLLDRVAGWVHGARAVVLDLSDVAFFDSSGVRLVDRFWRECGGAGAGLRVVAPHGGRARRVLEVVGMADRLVSEDLDGAVAALSV